jgi:hypothetical protein
MLTYRADYENEEVMEVFDAEDDETALREAWSHESEHGTLFNLFEIDDNYDVVRTVL